MTEPRLRHRYIVASYFATVLVCAGLSHVLQLPPVFTGVLCSLLTLLPGLFYQSISKRQANGRMENLRGFIQRIIDVIPEPVYVKDEQSRYITINRAFAEHLHCAPELILGRTAEEVMELEPETVAMVAHEDQRALAGESFLKENRVFHPSTGREHFQIVTKGSCVDMQGRRVIVGTNFDITALRRTEAQLKEALNVQEALTERTRTYIQSLLDVIPYPTYIRDAQSHYLIVNESFLTERGLGREEILGKTPVDLAPGTTHAKRSIDEDRAVLAGGMLKKEEGGQHPVTGELYFQYVVKGRCIDPDGGAVIVGINLDITSMRAAEVKLQVSLDNQRKYHQSTMDFVQRILDLLPYPVYVKDAQSRYIMVNTAMARDHFVRKEQLLNRTGLLGHESSDQLRLHFEEDGQVLAGQQILREDQGPHPITGRETFRIISKGMCTNAAGEPVIVGASVNLTDLRLAEQELKLALDREVSLRGRTLEFIQRLLNVIPDPVYVKTAEGRYLMVNHAFSEYHNIPGDAPLADSVLFGTLALGIDTGSAAEDLSVMQGTDIIREEHTQRSATGEEVFRVVHKHQSIYFDGTPVIIGIDHQITQWRIAERELQRLAQEDVLTQIANRRHFQNEAYRILARAARYNEPISLLMLDLDHFKLINDRWGHQTGDEVLVETVRRMHTSLRNSDIPARWGGEEFIVILPATDKQESRAVAERLRASIADTIFITYAAELTVTASFGVAQWALDEPLDQLVLRVDSALYRAKESGRNTVVEAL